MSQLYREVQSIMNDYYMICLETGVRVCGASNATDFTSTNKAFGGNKQ